jgi:hypothetical protein
MTTPHRNGCHNRADYVTHITQQDGWTKDGRRITVMTPHRMAQGCVYHTDALVGSKDPACAGCERKKTAIA